MKKKTVIIIGAGIAVMAAAIRLKPQGHNYKVIIGLSIPFFFRIYSTFGISIL